MVGTNPYTVVELRRRSRRCTVCPCCPLPVPCAVCACGLLCSVCTLLRHQCVRACCCAVRACCCVCSARVLLCRSRVLLRLQCVLAAAWVLLLRRPCAVCPCVRAAVSVDPRPVLSNPDVYTPGVGNNGRPQPLPCRGTAPSVRPAATVAQGPFHRFRTFIPRRWETMVGTNPYHVVALPRRPAVSPCCLLPVPSAVCACVLLCRARVLLRQQCVGAAALALRSCVRACCVGRVRSVRPCVRAAASAAHGPFRGFRAFIPRWWETMVGSNPYHVARSVRSAASVAHGRFHRFRTFIPRRWETMVGTNPYFVVALRCRDGRCTVCPFCVCCLFRAQSARACALLRRLCVLLGLLCVGARRSVGPAVRAAAAGIQLTRPAGACPCAAAGCARLLLIPLLFSASPCGVGDRSRTSGAVCYRAVVACVLLSAGLRMGAPSCVVRPPPASLPPPHLLARLPSPRLASNVCIRTVSAVGAP